MKRIKKILITTALICISITAKSEILNIQISPADLKNLMFQKIYITQNEKLASLSIKVPSACLHKLNVRENTYDGTLFISISSDKTCVDSIKKWTPRESLKITEVPLKTPKIEVLNSRVLLHSDTILDYDELEVSSKGTTEADTCLNCSHSASRLKYSKENFKKIKKAVTKEALHQIKNGNLKKEKYFYILGQSIISEGFSLENIVISDDYSPTFGKHTAHEKNKINYHLFLDEKLGLQISLFDNQSSLVNQQNFSLGLKKDIIEQSTEFFYKYSTRIDSKNFIEFSTHMDRSGFISDKKFDLKYKYIF